MASTDRPVQSDALVPGQQLALLASPLPMEPDDVLDAPIVEEVGSDGQLTVLNPQAVARRRAAGKDVTHVPFPDADPIPPSTSAPAPQFHQHRTVVNNSQNVVNQPAAPPVSDVQAISEMLSKIGAAQSQMGGGLEAVAHAGGIAVNVLPRPQAAHVPPPAVPPVPMPSTSAPAPLVAPPTRPASPVDGARQYRDLEHLLMQERQARIAKDLDVARLTRDLAQLTQAVTMLTGQVQSLHHTMLAAPPASMPSPVVPPVAAVPVSSPPAQHIAYVPQHQPASPQLYTPAINLRVPPPIPPVPLDNPFTVATSEAEAWHQASELEVDLLLRGDPTLLRTLLQFPGPASVFYSRVHAIIRKAASLGIEKAIPEDNLSKVLLQQVRLCVSHHLDDLQLQKSARQLAQQLVPDDQLHRALKARRAVPDVVFQANYHLGRLGDEHAGTAGKKKQDGRTAPDSAPEKNGGGRGGKGGRGGGGRGRGDGGGRGGGDPPWGGD